MSFLRSSSASYDAGRFGEAKRLAVVLRILLHDTARSLSLLHALGIKTTLKYFDRYADGFGSGPSGRQPGFFFGVSIGFTSKGLRYYANLSEPKRTSEFNVYWNGVASRRAVLNTGDAT
jgi:hypothetical protein